MEMTDEIIQEEIEAYYELQTADQLQALSDPIRYRMILLLRKQAMTGAQISRAMNFSRARAHYYLKTLVDAGLVRYRGERIDNGLVGKYYRAISNYYSYDNLAEKLTKMDSTDPEAIRIFKSINEFATTLLETYRNDFHLSKELARAFYSTLETDLTETQYNEIVCEIRNLVNHLVAIKKENSNRHEDTSLTFRTTIFFNPIPENPIIKK